MTDETKTAPAVEPQQIDACGPAAIRGRVLVPAARRWGSSTRARRANGNKE